MESKRKRFETSEHQLNANGRIEVWDQKSEIELALLECSNMYKEQKSELFIGNPEKRMNFIFGTHVLSGEKYLRILQSG